MSWKDETPLERELHWQLEEANESLRRQQERETKARDERRRERQQEVRDSYRQADTWPEALGKQASLFAGEVSSEYDPTGYFAPNSRENDYFAQGMDACKRALELWPTVEQLKKAEIEHLTSRLNEIQFEIRKEVADQLDAERQTPGWKGVSSTLRDDDADPSSWLNW